MPSYNNLPITYDTSYNFYGWKIVPRNTSGTATVAYLCEFEKRFIKYINSKYGVIWKDIQDSFMVITRQSILYDTNGRQYGRGYKNVSRYMSTQYYENPVDISDPYLTRRKFPNGNIRFGGNDGHASGYTKYEVEITFGYLIDPNFPFPWQENNVMIFPTIFKFTINVDPTILIFDPTNPDSALGNFTISSVSPNSIKNVGTHTLTINGSKFTNDIKYVKLTGPTTITMSSKYISPTQIESNFRLYNSPLGLYNIKIKIGGGIVSKPSAIHITQGDYIDNKSGIFIKPPTNITTSTEIILYKPDNSLSAIGFTFPSVDVNFGPETINYTSSQLLSNMAKYTYVTPGNYTITMSAWKYRLVNAPGRPPEDPVYLRIGEPINITVKGSAIDPNPYIPPITDDPHPILPTITQNNNNERIISCQFNDGQASNITWYFGDGNTATGRRVTHEYTKEGTFTISVTYDK